MSERDSHDDWKDLNPPTEEGGVNINVNIGKNWTPEQIKKFQEEWDKVLTHRLRGRVKRT